jgi:FkbM family methyltransferase
MADPVWWHSFVPDKAIVYDIGANVGVTVREFAPLAERVYAFEPNPHCFQELRKQTADLENVLLFDIGLSNKIGSERVFTYRHWLLLPVNPNDPRYESPEYHPGQRSDLKGEFSVFFTTLDQIITVLPKPDFMKIDVDGMEWSVLDGARKVLHDQRPILYLELGVHAMYQRGDSARDLTALLSKCGYDFVVDSYGSPLRVTERLLLSFAEGFDHDINVLCVPAGDPRLEQWPMPPKDFE